MSRQPPSDSAIETLLTEFIEAIEDEEYDVAETAVEELADRYEGMRRNERTSVRRSLTAREQLDPYGDEQEPLQAHVQAAAGIDLARSELLLHAAVFLSDPEAGEPTELLESARSLRDREVDYERRRERAAPIADDIELAASVDILSIELPERPQEVGDRFDLAVEAANVGEEMAEEVQVDVTSPETVRVDSSSVSIGRLEEGDRETVEFVVTVDKPESPRVTVSVTSENAGTATKTVHLRVEELDDPAFEVAILDANDPVNAGGWFELTAEVINIGGEETTQTVEFLVGEDREPTDSQQVTLGPGETERITLGYETYPVQQDVTFPVYVVTENDEAERIVEVYAVDDGELAVSIVETNEPVAAGEWFELTAEVTNTGNAEVTEEVTFLVGEERELVDSETVTVGPGETKRISLGYETYPVQQDVTFPVYVVTDEDEDERIVEVYAVGG
ncbi:COG1361 family protein [Natrialbaceae archaeon A-gly3]